MLLQLNISNFALIEKLSISFEKGFNVLSGETGAGKSILIDAINYVLGIKFTKNSIRTGENKTFVEAVFTIENERTAEILKNFSIDFDDMLIISREAFKSGKSIAKVNGKTIILSQLREISSTIIDIHGQHENQNLMSAEKHILYLDNFGATNLLEAKKDYNEKYYNLKKIQAKIDELVSKTGEKDKMADFLKYQIDEIDTANLKIGEDSELEEKYSIISRGEKINKVLSGSYEQLYNGSENYPSIFDGIGSIVKEIRNIQGNSKEIKEIADSLESIYYNIEQNVSEIRNIKDNIDYNPQELEYLNSRLYTIDNLKKKYGDTIEKIAQYRNKISNDYDELVHYSEILEDLKKQRKILNDNAVESAKKVHEIRNKIALNLEKKVMDEFKYIGLEKSNFKVQILFNSDNLTENGADKVQFLITTNPGEPLMPLEKIVSGGELSRIMLALKTVFVNKDHIPSVIFDEIDTGISGRIAQRVAEKIYSISTFHQVFCVTHLPQIACMSDIHYLVEKNVIDNKTYTTVNRLSKKEKEESIARMIGGSVVTNLTIENAIEMIKLADEKKNSIKNP